MQVDGRLGGVMGRDSGGLLSLTIHVRGMLVEGRSGWVMGKYVRGLLCWENNTIPYLPDL